MRIRPLAVGGALEITPVQHRDARGMLLECYRRDEFARLLGHPVELVQANLSTSARGVVRGIHFADVPPGQAKLVTCVAGAVLDVAVDLRVGSPTFGRWEAVRLDDEDRRAVYLAEGLGHAFCALTEGATMMYLCSAEYRPGHEHGVDPLDPSLGIPWPTTEPRLSGKDAAAPGLAAAEAAGLLPGYDDCRAYLDARRTGLGTRRTN
ncbi:dTDP-4-dehydrorhamnose 3,5-epimerase [Actinoplanes sp. NPDC049802]|uniref:dTDP-4-dehydrorhamnose 3,5-epimerase n=1 Tax=Actinoplanes sp. NPDC049802 TaxID=3154742 RepID=UPI003406776E